MGSWLTLQRTLIICGPASSGKSTLRHQLTRLVGDTVPTMGFDRCSAIYGHNALDVYDTGGVVEMIMVWEALLPKADAVVFVLESLTPSALNTLLEFEVHMPQSMPLLVFVNKQDRSLAPDPALLRARLLHLKRPWRVFGSCFLASEGIDPGMRWLVSVL